jgi:large subunit ribosomal protein L23
MKNCVFWFVIIVMIAGCRSTQSLNSKNTDFVRLNSLFENHQYFKLADEFENSEKQLSERERFILIAKLNSVFNRKEISNSAIEELFKVDVAKVNTMNVNGRSKRVGRYSGKTADWKKAIVTLTEKSKTIEFFDGLM